MWTKMSEVMPESMVDNTSQGFERVLEGNYGFLWDDTVSAYKASSDCRFIEIGPRFDPKGLGIAVPPGAIYRKDLSLAILKLADSGFINSIEHKYVKI